MDPKKFKLLSQASTSEQSTTTVKKVKTKFRNLCLSSNQKVPVIPEISDEEENPPEKLTGRSENSQRTSRQLDFNAGPIAGSSALPKSGKKPTHLLDALLTDDESDGDGKHGRKSYSNPILLTTQDSAEREFVGETEKDYDSDETHCSSASEGPQFGREALEDPKLKQEHRKRNKSSGSSGSDDTFCSTVSNEEENKLTVQEVKLSQERNPGSESLFSTESSEKTTEESEEKILARQKSQLDDEKAEQLSRKISSLILGEHFTGHTRTSSASPYHGMRVTESWAATTISNTSSFLDEFKGVLPELLNSHVEVREKGDYESPEKEKSEPSLADTEDMTLIDEEEIPQNTLADTVDMTLPDTQDQTINDTKQERLADTLDHTPEGVEIDVLSISSGSSDSASNRSDIASSNSVASAISLSDESESRESTPPEKSRGSSQIEEIVSDLSGTPLRSQNSILMHKFFDNIPPLLTPVQESYMKNIDQGLVGKKRRSTSIDTDQSLQRHKVSSPVSGQEFVPESESEDEQQAENIPETPVVSNEQPQPSVSPESSSEESSQEQPVTQINISANVHISIKIETPELRRTDSQSIGSSGSNTPRVYVHHRSPVIEINTNGKKQDVKQKERESKSGSKSAKAPQSKVDRSPKPGPSRQVNEDDQLFRTPKAVATKKDTSKDLKERQNRIFAQTEAPPAAALDEINEEMEQILNNLYGTSWQTPDLLGKLTSKKKTKPATEIPMVNETRFSQFHQNIRCNLESTRLTPPKPNPSPAMVVRQTTSMDTRRSPTQEEDVSTDDSKAANPTNNFSQRAIRKAKPKKFMAICDTDTSSPESSSSDKSWHGGEKSSDSECSDPTPAKVQRKKRTARTKNPRRRIPSYSGSSGSEEESIWTDKKTIVKSPEMRLNNVLDSCEFKGKPKINPTPNRKAVVKRKLYNPNQENDVVPTPQLSHDISEDNKENSKKGEMDEDISRISVDLLAIPDFFPTPINKKLERIKETEIGKPLDKGKTTPKKTPTSSKKVLSEISSPENIQVLGFLESLDVNVPAINCDSMALHFRKNYKSKRDELAKRLFSIFDENVFDGELKDQVPMTWNKKLLQTAGRCCLSKKGGERKCRIELSEKVLTSADRLRCTLVHEMCHAATWIFHGEDGHGRTWKAYASKANKKFPTLPKINICHSYDIEYKYTYKCTLCHASSYAHSKSKKIEEIRCKYCHGKIEILLNKKNKDGQITATPTRKATGFAKYVKEQYKMIKQPHLNHGEVMKLLGENFGGLSVEEKAMYK